MRLSLIPSSESSFLLGAWIMMTLALSGPAQAASTDRFALRNTEVGGPFTLIDQFGETRRLEDFRGQIVVLSFGFTNCPDICPTTLADLGAMLSALGDQAEAVAVVFVTVDPARDTPQRLREYLPHFGDTMVGLTGSEADISEVAARYDIRFQRGQSDATGHYAVDHSSFIYLLDTTGRARYVIPYKPGSPWVLEGVQALLAEGA